MIFLRMFSRRWIIATLLVIFGVGLCIRLGIWQLDRLEQRRAFNTRVLAQIDQPTLMLDAVFSTAGEALSADIANMEYRPVQATGEYDFSQEIALRNQYYGSEWGVHLITPLKIAGSDQTILVDRGWIPAADFEAGDWSKFAEPGVITITGVIRAAQSKAQLGNLTDPTPAPGEAPRQAWYFVNIELISRQISYPLLPAYIQQAPDPAWSGLPYRTQPEIEISEGPHMGYALQWFTFATILGVGYPFFMRRQEKRSLTAGSIPD